LQRPADRGLTEQQTRSRPSDVSLFGERRKDNQEIEVSLT
jgi:hypothetical protein